VLIGDDAAVLFLPLPDPRHKRLTAQIVPCKALLRQLSLHYILRGDAGVIRPRHPEGRMAQHAVIADHEILDRSGDRMPEVKATGHIGRRHRNDKRFPTVITAWLEVTPRLPPVIDPLLCRLRVICFGHFALIKYSFFHPASLIGNEKSLSPLGRKGSLPSRGTTLLSAPHATPRAARHWCARGDNGPFPE